MHTFTVPIAREQLEATRKSISKNHDVYILGDRGTANSHGVALEFEYDGAELKFTVVRKPFYITQGSIESAVRDWFKT